MAKTVNTHDVETLKAEGHFFAAGALLYSLGGPYAYGCHFGMRSTRDAAIRQFVAGYQAAERAAATLASI